MAPVPDPNATTATIIDSANTVAIAARAANVRRGSARSGEGSVIGRIMVGVTGAIVGALCGVTAAVLMTTSVVAGEAPASEPVAVAALTTPSLAGRWSGQPYAIQNDATRCENGECKLVLDIVACAGGWCAIEVDTKNACAAEVMQLKTHSDPKRKDAFEGKLSLGKDTQSYVIDANVQPAEDGRPATLEIVGDTGPEFRWFRRSFPFHATSRRQPVSVSRSVSERFLPSHPVRAPRPPNSQGEAMRAPYPPPSLPAPRTGLASESIVSLPLPRQRHQRHERRSQRPGRERAVIAASRSRSCMLPENTCTPAYPASAPST